MQVHRICLPHNIQHQNVTIAVMILTWVFYKNIGNPNHLSKCLTNRLSLQRMYQTFYKVTEYQFIYKIQFLKNTQKFGVLLYVVSGHLYFL